MKQTFEFVTDTEQILFGVGSPYVLSEADGLNEGEVLKQTAAYIDVDGTDYLSLLYAPRTVVLKGFIRARNTAELITLRAGLVKILNGKTKGRLYYTNEVRCCWSEALPELPQFGQAVQNVLPFAVYFNLYKFYWKGRQNNIIGVFGRVHHIDTPFALHAELEKNSSLESVNARIVVKTTQIAVLTLKYNENEVISDTFALHAELEKNTSLESIFPKATSSLRPTASTFITANLTSRQVFTRFSSPRKAPAISFAVNLSKAAACRV